MRNMFPCLGVLCFAASYLYLSLFGFRASVSYTYLCASCSCGCRIGLAFLYTVFGDHDFWAGRIFREQGFCRVMDRRFLFSRRVYVGVRNINRARTPCRSKKKKKKNA